MFQVMNQTRSLVAVAALAVGLVMAPSANAGLLIEPYLGYESGQTYAVASSLGDASYKTSGTVIGARLGYSLGLIVSSLWAGLDYSLVTGGTAKADFGGTSSDLARTNLYAVLGVDLPILLRAWVGYGLLNEAKTTSNGVENKVTGGTKMKAGLGLTLLPLVSVNLELFNTKGPKFSAAGVDTTMSTFEEAGGVLSLSLPLDI